MTFLLSFKKENRKRNEYFDSATETDVLQAVTEQVSRSPTTAPSPDPFKGLGGHYGSRIIFLIRTWSITPTECDSSVMETAQHCPKHSFEVDGTARAVFKIISSATWLFQAIMVIIQAIFCPEKSVRKLLRMKWYLNKIFIQVSADASLSATFPSSHTSSYLLPSYLQIQIIGTRNKQKGVQSVRQNRVQWDIASTPVTSNICSKVAHLKQQRSHQWGLKTQVAVQYLQ